MGNTLGVCSYHRRGCYYSECVGCHTETPSSSGDDGDDTNNKQGSVCFYSALEVAVHRIFLLLPLLDVIGITDETIREQFLGTRRIDPRWCVSHLMDMTGSCTLIAEAVASISTDHMFRSYTFPDYGKRVSVLLGEKRMGAYISYVTREATKGSGRQAPWCTCLRTDSVLTWDQEFMVTHMSLAALLLAHQCVYVDEKPCDGCIALTTGVLDREELRNAPKSLGRARSIKGIDVPALVYYIPPPYGPLWCRPQPLIAMGQDLEAFVASFSPTDTNARWWACVKRLIPEPYNLKERGEYVRELAAVLGAVGVDAAVRTITAHEVAATRPNWPPSRLFLACRSVVCWPLLRGFVCAFLKACTRGDLLCQKPRGVRVDTSRSFIRTLFINEKSGTIAAVRTLVEEAGCDLLLEEMAPILCDKLSPTDCLLVTRHEYSVFRHVCARGSLHTVKHVYNYVKTAMSDSGMSLSSPHAPHEPYCEYDDFINAAIDFNTAEVCAFLFSEAQWEQRCDTKGTPVSVWRDSAAMRGNADIIDVFKTHTMVKGAI